MTLTKREKAKLRLELVSRMLGITASEATTILELGAASESEIEEFLSSEGKEVEIHLPNGKKAYAHPMHPMFSASKRKSNKLKVEAAARRTKPREATTFVAESAKKFE